MTASKSALRSIKKRVAGRKALVDALKRMTPCADCGGTFPPEAMDFDHVRGTKIGNISMMLHRNLDVLEAEISKCEIVCSNCHRVRTLARRRQVNS